MRLHVKTRRDRVVISPETKLPHTETTGRARFNQKPRRHWTQEEINDVVEFYCAGISKKELVELFHTNALKIDCILLEHL